MTTQLKTALGLLSGIGACLLLVSLVYWKGLNGEFMLDDGANIVYAHINDSSWDATVYAITHNGSGTFGRSVSILSFVLTGMQYGLDPWGYKYHNLLLHLLNGVLLFYLLLQVLPLLDRQLDKTRVLLVAAATSTLWLLHPLQVSTVLYAVQRMSQMATLFTVLALLAYIKARLSVSDKRRFYLFGWFLFPLLTGLAVLSKENGALIPVYVLALEFLALRPTLDELRANRRLALFLCIFIAAPILLGTALLILQFDSLANYNVRTFTLGERLLTQVHVMFFYVRLILLPRIRDMSLFHDDYPIVSQPDLATGILFGLLMLLLVAIWWLRNSRPVVAFGLAWFLAAHLMESTVIPLEMVFEHRNYFALGGLLLIVIHTIFKSDQFKFARVLCPVLIAGMSLMTATRAAEWGEPEVFHRMAITEHPGSPRALNNYLAYLLPRGTYDEVIAALEKQIELTPEEAGSWIHLQVVLCGRDTRDDEALPKARELLSQYPASVYGLNGLQSLLIGTIEERCSATSLEEVQGMIETALAYVADHPHPQNESFLLRMRGMVAFSQGYYAQGYAYFRMAHELTPDIQLLAELARYQVDADNVADAQETLLLMEQQSAARFGIDEYQVDIVRDMIEEARQRLAQTSPPQVPGNE